MNKAQPFFDLFQEEKTGVSSKSASAPVSSPTAARPFHLRQAVLGWLAVQSPSGIGIQAPTRISKYRADIAAFWSAPEKQLLKPVKTVIIEIRDERELCWPDCGDSDRLLRELRKKKEQKTALEAKIRLSEPVLKESDNLFDEYESWNYSASSNREYQHCLKQIEKLQHSLYKGSRFEQIRRGHVADLLYLAVPAGEVHADELADGWGLLYIDSARNVIEVKKPELQEPPESNRLHLAQSMAASAMKSLLFVNGINLPGNGKVVFTPPPRRRRARQ